MEGDRGLERSWWAVGRFWAEGGGVGVTKVVGQEHCGAKRGCPLKYLWTQVLEEGGGAPAAKQHDVGGGMSGQEECHGGSGSKRAGANAGAGKTKGGAATKQSAGTPKVA